MKVLIQTKDGRHKVKDLNRRKAIRERCLNCSGWSLPQVRNCEIIKCKLHPFRSGNGKQDSKARVIAIREYCLWCAGGSRSEVYHCPAKDCPLFAFRKQRIDRTVEINLKEKKDHIAGFSEANQVMYIPSIAKAFFYPEKTSIGGKLNGQI